MHVCKLILQVAGKGSVGGCSEGLSVSSYWKLHAVNTVNSNIRFLSVMHAPLKLERKQFSKADANVKQFLFDLLTSWFV